MHAKIIGHANFKSRTPNRFRGQHALDALQGYADTAKLVQYHRHVDGKDAPGTDVSTCCQNPEEVHKGCESLSKPPFLGFLGPFEPWRASSQELGCSQSQALTATRIELQTNCLRWVWGLGFRV